MPRRYAFVARHGDWPFDRPARTAQIRVVNKSDNKVTDLLLTAGDARALAIEAMRALAYTKVSRADGQWEATWKRDIDSKIAPLVSVINALLPKVTSQSTEA